MKAQIPQSYQSFFVPTRTILEWSMVSIEIIGNPTVASGCLFLFSGISLSEFLQAYLQCDGPQHGRTQPWTLEGNLQRHHGAHDAYLILFDLIFTHSTTKKLYPLYQVVLFQGQGGRFEAKIKGNETCPTRDVSLDCHWRLHLLKKLKKQQVLPFHSSVLHGWCCADYIH